MKAQTLITFLLCLSVCGHSRSYCDYVNPFLGSSGDHGQLTPAALVPFGMVCIGPDTDPFWQSGYDFSVTKTSGVSVTRMSGTGAKGGGGQLRIFPSGASEDLHIDKSTESAYPGYYETAFSNGVKVRLTATVSTAVEQYTFPYDAKERILKLDTRSSYETRIAPDSDYTIVDDRTIEGWTRAATVGAFGAVRYFFVLHSSEPFELAGNDGRFVTLSFNGTRTVEIRISLSSVDIQGARDVAATSSGRSFEWIRMDAARLWEKKLSAFRISTKDEDLRTLFYTGVFSLYHSPVIVSTPDGRYHGTDDRIYVADGFTPYAGWSLWDSFRTKFPLFNIVEPDQTSSICTSLLNLYRTGKKNWATPSEAAMTVRTEHSIITIYDAWVKGIKGIDFRIGYEGMKKEASDNLRNLRKPDQKLETAYDIWALSRISRELGLKEEADHYGNLTDSLFRSIWRSTFMEVTPDFNKMKNNGMYQGSKAQYRFSSPQAFDKMIEWVGKEKLAGELETFFEEYRFNQGNEPDIHYPFVFNILGHPEKSQHWVRRYLTDDTMVHLYGGNTEYATPFVGRAFQNKPDAFAPEMDEDDGTMSAWFIFASLGFYPVQLGTDRYEVVSPLFDKAKIRVGKGKWFTIRTKGRKNPDDIARFITIDGEKTDSWHITHNDIAAGKTLTVNY